MSWWIWSGETCCLRTAHLYKSVWFSPAEEKRSSSGHAVRLCFGKQAKDAMPCLLAHSLMCIVILSVYLSVCLSLSLTHTHTPPTVRSFCDVCLPFLLNHYTIHWRAPTRHLFSECEWITFQYCLTMKGVQVFKQIPFMLSESSVTPQSANMPLQKQMAFKGVGFVCMCMWMSIQIGDPSGVFGAWICSSIKNPMVPQSFTD